MLDKIPFGELLITHSGERQLLLVGIYTKLGVDKLKQILDDTDKVGI